MFFRSVSFFRLWCWETSVLHLKVENVFKLASVHNQLKGNLQKKQKLVFKKVALLIVCDKWDRNQSVWSVLISVSHWLAQTSSSKILICKKSSNARKQSVQQSDQRQHYFCSWPPPRADKSLMMRFLLLLGSGPRLSTSGWSWCCELTGIAGCCTC